MSIGCCDFVTVDCDVVSMELSSFLADWWCADAVVVHVSWENNVVEGFAWPEIKSRQEVRPCLRVK